MLAARITRHVRSQNWFAVLIEFLVVVLGIFIGLQVTDWNQSRLDRVTELRFLLALQTDLEVSTEYIMDTRESLDAMRSSLVRLAEIGDHGMANVSPEELDQLIAKGMWDLAILKVQMDAYQELKSSNATSLLGSTALRLNLSRWSTDMERYRQAETDSIQVQYRNLDNYLSDYFPMRRFTGVFATADGLPPPMADTRPDYEAFLSRKETQNRVTMKYISASNARNFLLALDDRAAQLRGLVADRLAELGHTPALEEN